MAQDNWIDIPSNDESGWVDVPPSSSGGFGTGLWDTTGGMLKHMYDEVNQNAKKAREDISKGMYIGAFQDLTKPLMGPLYDAANKVAHGQPIVDKPPVGTPTGTGPVAKNLLEQALSGVGVPTNEFRQAWESGNYPRLAGQATGALGTLGLAHYGPKAFSFDKYSYPSDSLKQMDLPFEGLRTKEPTQRGLPFDEPIQGGLPFPPIESTPPSDGYYQPKLKVINPPSAPSPVFPPGSGGQLDLFNNRPPVVKSPPLTESQPPIVQPSVVQSTPRPGVVGPIPENAAPVRNDGSVGIPTKNLNEQTRANLDTAGLREAGKSPDGLITFFKRLGTEEKGTFDWDELKAGLRRVLEREPTEQEVQRASFEMGAGARPGEETGRVAPFLTSDERTQRLDDLGNVPPEGIPNLMQQRRLEGIGETQSTEPVDLGPQPTPESFTPRVFGGNEPIPGVERYAGGIADPTLDRPRPIGKGQGELPWSRGDNPEQSLNLDPNYIPPPTYENMRGDQPVYHGTQDVITKFNPRHKGEGLLGNMTHFSEDPGYSEEYAYGWHAGGPEGDTVQIPHQGELTARQLKGAQPNIIPGVPKTNRVLDLTKPFSASDEAIISKAMGTDQWSINQLNDLLEDSNFTKNLPYDAYKYQAHGVDNWAFPQSTEINTPAGTSLTRSLETQLPLKLRSQKYWDQMTVKMKPEDIKRMEGSVTPDDATDLSHGYAKSTLRNIGRGPAGLEVSDAFGSTLDDPNHVPNLTEQNNAIDVVWRNKKGEPLAAAVISTNANGKNGVTSFIYDKSRGLAGGRAAFRVGQKLMEYGALEPDGSYSNHVVNFINKMKEFITDDKGTMDVPQLIKGLEDLKGKVPEFIGKQFKKGPKGEPSTFDEMIGLTPAATTTGDVSMPLRQGWRMIFTPEWRKALGPMFRAGISAEKAKEIDTEIRSKPIFTDHVDTTTGKIIPSFAERHGMKLIEGNNITKSEYDVGSNWIENGGNIPYFSKVYRETAGKYIAKPSNRAASTFLNHLRANTYEKLLNNAQDMSARASAGEKIPLPGIMGGFKMPDILGGSEIGFKKNYTQEAAGELNPYQNDVLAKELADFVNTATGRAPLKTHLLPYTPEVNLEKAAGILRYGLFSPRNMFSQIRMMNPSTYVMASPLVRKQYMKAALSTYAAWYGVAQLAKGAGAMTGTDVEVNDDLDSADFGKVRIGDVRLDPGGGNQQFMVAAHRLWSGGWTSSATGDWHRFGEGFRAETQGDAMERFFVNKLNPVTKFAYDLAHASDYQPFQVYDRTLQMFVPLVFQDTLELAKENPALIPWLTPLVMGGMGTQIYDKGEATSRFIDPENDWTSTGGGIRDIFSSQ